MKVILHDLHKRNDGSIQIGISLGEDPVKTFNALCDKGPKYKCCSMDQELFMQLSDLSHRKYGNCVVYQIELGNILTAFLAGDKDLVLPATLGTTEYCRFKPSRPRIMWNIFLVLLYRVGLYRPRVQIHT